jgi:TPP-dependent pyruvate/acetoin dehydrogenase alpha subunit
MSDPQKYRSKEEVEEYKQQDPIEDVRKKLLDNAGPPRPNSRRWTRP